jgi:aspartate/methionine/tyrosine aminotransferase
MNNQAIELNEIIKKESETVHSLLSKKGLNIFFPKKGILSQTQEAKGKKINATIGEAVNDDGGPMYLTNIKDEINIKPSEAFPYAPSFGKPDMRNKWKTLIFEKNPSLKDKEISLPVVTNALTHGLSIAGYLFVNENDTILIPDLYWENYDLIFENAYNAKLKKYLLFNDNGLNLDSLKKSLIDSKPGKKILVLNFPNNPTGYTPTIDESKKIVSIIKESAEAGNKILVLLDDAYFGLVYEDNIIKESLFSHLADIHENVLTIKIDGPTKEDYVWGFRVGFLTYATKNGSKELYSALEMKTGGAIRGNISNAPHLSQSLLLNAYSFPDYNEEKEKKYNILKTRFLTLKKIFTDKKYEEYFKPLPFNSGYFMCIKLTDGIDAEELRVTLLNEFDTGVINMSGVIRIAYSSVSNDKLPELIENIYKASAFIKGKNLTVSAKK